MLRLLQAEVSTQVSKRVRFRIAKPQNWIIGNSPFHGLLKGGFVCKFLAVLMIYDAAVRSAVYCFSVWSLTPYEQSVEKCQGI